MCIEMYIELGCSTETETEHIKSMSTCKIIWLCWSLSLWTKCRKNYGKLVAVTYLKAGNSEGTGGTVRRGGMQSQLVPGPGLVCPGLCMPYLSACICFDFIFNFGNACLPPIRLSPIRPSALSVCPSFYPLICSACLPFAYQNIIWAW